MLRKYAGWFVGVLLNVMRVTIKEDYSFGWLQVLGRENKAGHIQRGWSSSVYSKSTHILILKHQIVGSMFFYIKIGI